MVGLSGRAQWSGSVVRVRAGRGLAVGDALLQLDDRELADLDLVGGRVRVRAWVRVRVRVKG